MKNDSCLTVSRRAAIIRQDAEENYGTLLTLGESMRRAYPVSYTHLTLPTNSRV